MKKKKTKIVISPLEQSNALAYIHAIFIKPLLAHKPEDKSVASWLNFLFCTDERTIQEYVALAPCKIPGWLRGVPSYEQKKAFRKLKPGSSIWVRIDSTVPEYVEIEAVNGVGGKVQIFELTRVEWEALWQSGVLRTAPKRRKKTKKPAVSSPR